MTQTRLIDEITGTGQTAGGGTITVISATPPNSINSLVFAWVLATGTSTNERASWLRGASVHKDSGGVVTLDSETDLIPSFASNNMKHASIASVISGGTIQLQVTGDGSPGAPATIDWQAVVRFYRS